MSSRLRQQGGSAPSVAAATPPALVLSLDSVDGQPVVSPIKLTPRPELRGVDEGGPQESSRAPPERRQYSCFGLQLELRYLTFLPLVILFFIAMRSQDMNRMRHSQKRLDMILDNSRALGRPAAKGALRAAGGSARL